MKALTPYATVGALATLELLLARATGGPVSPSDVGAAALLWLVLALASSFRRELLLVPLVLYAVGLLTPVVLHLPAWHVLSGVVVALLVVVLRRRTAVRPLLAGVGAVAALSLTLVAADEQAWPPWTVALGVFAACGACLALGRWSPLLVPVALVPTLDEGEWSPSEDASGPDVVLISIDTLRFDAAEGMKSVHWLTRRGSLLQAQTPSPWTLPSMATLMTGLEPHEHGGLRISGGYSAFSGPTLAEHYQDQGYNTAATAENPFVGAPFGFDRGFDVFLHDGGTRFAMPRVPWTRTARPLAGTLLAQTGLLSRTPVGVDQRLADASELLDESEDPLFLWVHILDPHLPYAHAWGLDRPLREQVALATGNRLSLGDSPDFELLREGYDHEVDVVDRALLPFLKGLEPGTVVVLVSDHGEAFGEHGGWEHGHSMYQELLSVPLVVSGIDVLPGPAGLIDVPKTLAGLGDGHDLRHPRIAVPYTASNPLYGEPDLRAVRFRDQKLMVTPTSEQAYDLAADPLELRPDSNADLRPLLPPAPNLDGTAVEDDTLRALQELGYIE
jgi:hypothetical protein